MEMFRKVFATPPTGPELAGVMVSRSRLNELNEILALTTHQDAVENLSQILSLLRSTSVAEHVYVDPRLARGLSYYTGAIMEVAVPDLAGSLGGGGRYDNLVGMFLGRDVPACGFSLGLERIIVVMTDRGMFPAKVSRGAVDVMVTFLGDGQRADALKLAA
jgi:histidyl-tRNA synthetase